MSDANANEAVTYFIGGDAGPVKIGRSADLAQRLACFQTGSPVLLQVLGVVAIDQIHDENGASMTYEALCHSLLADHRLHGEWFEREAVEAFWRDRAVIDYPDLILACPWPEPAPPTPDDVAARRQRLEVFRQVAAELGPAPLHVVFATAEARLRSAA